MRNQPPPIPKIPPETPLFLGTTYRGQKLHWGIKDTKSFTGTGLVTACLPTPYELFPQPKLPPHLRSVGLDIYRLPRCIRCRKIRPLPEGTQPKKPATRKQKPAHPRGEHLTHTIADALPAPAPTPTPAPAPLPEKPSAPAPAPAPALSTRHRPARTKSITRKKGPTS